MISHIEDRVLAAAYRLTAAVLADPIAVLILVVGFAASLILIAVAWHYYWRGIARFDRWRAARRTAKRQAARTAQAAGERQGRHVPTEHVADTRWQLPRAQLARFARARRQLRTTLRRNRTRI